MGGADIEQISESGASIKDAIVKASRAEAVPTLGTLPAEPVYRMLGRKLPDLTAHELDGKTPRALSGLLNRGKKLLVFYWSPTCPHCKRALPKLSDWLRTQNPDDLEVIDIARADSPYLSREIPRIVKDYPFMHLLDSDRSIARSLVVRSTPTSFLIAPDGEILSIKVGGSVDWARWLGAH